MKFLGHWRIFFFRVAKTEKKCPEEHIKESPFSKGKNLLNFWDSERNLHFNLAENFVRVVKTVTYVALEDFEEKKHVWNFALCFKFPLNFRQKYKSFIQKIFSELSQMPSARPQESFAENQFFYQRNFVFC